MIVNIKIQNMKDKSGELKRVMWTTVATKIKGIDTFTTVAELGNETPLAKEVDEIVTQMMDIKKKDIAAKNKEKIAKAKKVVKK